MAVVPASSALGNSTHDRIFPRRRGLSCSGKQSGHPGTPEGGQKFCKTLPHPVLLNNNSSSWSLCRWQSTGSGSRWLHGTWQGGSVYLTRFSLSMEIEQADAGRDCRNSRDEILIREWGEGNI